MRLMLALSAAGVIASAAAADQLVVVTRGDNTVAIVDADTLAVEHRATVGDNPHEAVASPDGRRAFISDYGMSRGSTITVLDAPSGAVEATWALNGEVGPHGIAASGDGSRVWVTAERQQAVIELDAATGEETARWATARPGSHQLVAAPDGSRLYVANIPANSVTVIDRESGDIAWIDTDAGPEGIDISPDGETLWVANRSANTISVIDTATNTVEETIESGGQVPFRLKFTPDGEEVWVVNAESREIAVFDTASREIIDRIGFDLFPVGILIAPDGETVFISHTADESVSVVDRASRTVRALVETGPQPDGMAYVVTR